MAVHNTRAPHLRENQPVVDWWVFGCVVNIFWKVTVDCLEIGMTLAMSLYGAVCASGGRGRAKLPAKHTP